MKPNDNAATICGDFNQRSAHMDEQTTLASVVGKTIASADFRRNGGDEGGSDEVVLRFTDGSSLSLCSWDAYNYSSGISVGPEGD